MYAAAVIESPTLSAPLAKARDALRARGMRWTPQRRALLELLFESEGHVTGAELLERARARDPETQPSTVYRTLDAIEEVGLVVHSHGVDGREEYHVLPHATHGHLTCNACGGRWELTAKEARRAGRRPAHRARLPTGRIPRYAGRPLRELRDRIARGQLRPRVAR